MQSHHKPNGGFRNPWPGNQPPPWYKVPRLFIEMQQATRITPSPKRGSIPIVASSIEYPRSTREGVSATWIGHATTLMQFGALNVLTDPMFSQRASPFSWTGPRRVVDAAVAIDALPPLDVVLISHNHYDHLDQESVIAIARANPNAKWIVPLGVAECIRNWGARDIVELDWWQQTTVLGMNITATPAKHFSSRSVNDRDKSLWCGFALEMNGIRMYFAGDTAYHPEFSEVGKRCGPFDFVMIPIGAYEPRWMMRSVHANAEEAVQIYKDVTSTHPGAPLPLMLAIHWGTFRLTTEPMDEPPRRARASWRASGLDEGRLWVAQFGETRRVMP